MYGTADSVDQRAGQNEQFIQVKGAIRPLEDFLLEGSFTYLWTAEDVHTTAGVQSSGTRSKQLGWEVDLQATYDYTEDVSFGVLVGWFTPGNFFDFSPSLAGGAANDTATDIVSSVKVTF